MGARKCSECGAVLPPSRGGRVTCKYCGASINSSVAIDGPVEPPTRWRGVIVAVIAVAMLGLGLTLAMRPGSLFSEWYSYTTMCFVDADGDDVLDPVGFSGSPTAQNHLTAIDGRGGARRWSTEIFPERSVVMCGDRDIVYVAQPDFSLVAFDGRGRKRWSVRLGDVADKVGRGAACSSVTTRDNHVTGIADADGATVSCTPAKPPANIYPDRNNAELVFQGHTITLAARDRGTPILTLHSDAWSTDLPAQAIGGTARNGLAMAAVGSTIVVAGAAVDDDQHLVVCGLDATNGRLLYHRVEDSHYSGQLATFTADPPWVIAVWGWGLHAYNPATGERVWHIGGR